MMRRLIKWLLVAIVVVGIGGFIFWQSNKPRPISVTVSTADSGIVERTVANTRAGTIKACRRAQLSPGTAGLIAALNVQKGDFVKKGDLLMSLWNKDLMAEMELSRAESQSVHANASASCLTAEVAEREANRLLKLQKSGSVSEERVDRAVTDASARRASCDAAKASAVVSSSRINLIQTRLERTQLVAPFDGVVANLKGELYEYVTPSSSGVAGSSAIDLINSSCFYVAAPIDEVDAPRVRLGQSARVTLDAFGAREFTGIVNRIAPFVVDLSAQARTVEIEVELTNANDLKELLAGYSADVEVILDTRNSAVRVPSEAVLEDQYAYVLNGDTIEKRDVMIGISNWGWTEIEDGISFGELVVTSVDVSGLSDGVMAITEDMNLRGDRFSQ